MKELRGNEFTRKGDIYSFGGIMYEIVAVQRTFADDTKDSRYYDLNLMYRFWNDDPLERPTADELFDLFYEISDKFSDYIVDDDVMQQLQQNISKSQKQELFDLFSHSKEIKSGKSSDPNLLIKSNKSTISRVNTRNYDEETEIQSK
ncbi:hypothetical protein Glove_87g24 [Diversispora epigaea]|uniref:Protein kinase domain-containing protein n=1 Tax=Diversispora epigaea TaxID=1348612 RepID=A0A397J743_9GLOM|nr:hypothetical protein Glove_87g24 [Diversispora epigaea]